MNMRLKNVADVPLRGLKARVLTLHSQLGILSIENADNGLETVSAIWDFGPSLSDGELAPGEMSAEKTLRFHLADLRPFDWCVASSVSHSSTRVFSALSENESFG